MAVDLIKSSGAGYPLASRPVELINVVVGVALTLVLHVTIIGLVAFGTSRTGTKMDEEIEPKMLKFEQVDLLTLGEEKPPNQLPRIANPAPPEKRPDEIILDRPDEPVVELEKPDEKPEAKEKEDPDERKKKMLDALSSLHNPDRPTNEEIPEGGEEGVIGGNVSDAALANLTATYAARLNLELTRAWEVPKTVDSSEIERLSGQVSVYVRLSNEGYVTSFRFTRKSDNTQFNDSIDRVLKRFQVSYGGRKLPLPEQPEVRDAVLRQGINLNSWEYTGQ